MHFQSSCPHCSTEFNVFGLLLKHKHKDIFKPTKEGKDHGKVNIIITYLPSLKRHTHLLMTYEEAYDANDAYEANSMLTSICTVQRPIY
jgi:hypothetical protein